MKPKQKPLSYKPTRGEKRAIIFMILPALIELLLSQTFAVIDSAMLGNAADATTSIAAVGLSNPLIGLLINIMNAFTIGTTATVAWFLGSRDPKDAQATARQTLTVSAVLGLILTLVCTLGAKPIVGFMGAEDEAIRAGAVEYFFIIGIGHVFHFMTANISASLRGARITKYTMYYNLIANAANVGMNYVLIYGKLGFSPMGLRGAAIATTASKVLGFLLAFAVICLKKSPVQISFKKSFLPRKRIMNRVFRIGITAAAEQLLLQSGNVLFTKIIARIPKVDFSAFSVSQNISGFIWNVGGACAVAATTYMGISMGEGREDKCRGITAYVIRLSFLWMCCTAALIIVTAPFLPNLFINDPAVAAVATKLLPIAAIYALPVAIHLPLGGALRGAGDTISPLIAAFCSLWIFRVFLGWILVDLLNLGIFFAQIAVAADQFARALVDWILFRKGKWSRRFKPNDQNKASAIKAK